MKVFYQINNGNKGLRVTINAQDVKNLGTQHIVKLYNMATEEEKSRDWYGEANAFAVRLADETGYTVKQVADFIAAVSPMQKWEVNKWKAEVAIKSWIAMLDANVKGYEPLFDSLPKAHMYDQNTEKAYAILADMPYELGTKTGDFSKNIQLFRDTVTVDSLAAMLAVGLYEYSGTVGISKKAYGKIAEVYKQAANELGVTPSHLQAVTWEICRTERIKTKGSTTLFDGFTNVAEKSLDSLIKFLSDKSGLDVTDFSDEVIADLQHEYLLEEIAEYGGIDAYAKAMAA